VSNGNSANISLLVSRSEARQVFRDALRLYVGRGRRFSVKQLSNATGVPDRVIECMISNVESGDYRAPQIEHLLSISKFLREEFATEWLAPAGLAAFDLPDMDLPPPGELVAECANDTAEVAGRAADGEFCHDDRRALLSIGHRSVKRGVEIIAGTREWLRNHAPHRQRAA
jgi:transcriptional regulator with XRE-family HTH domain